MDRHPPEDNSSFGVITEVLIQERSIPSATGSVENVAPRFVTIIGSMSERGSFLCLLLFSSLSVLDLLVRI